MRELIKLDVDTMHGNGVFEISVNNGPWEVCENLIPVEGRNYILGAAVDGTAQQTAFYVALFSGNVTVLDSWTAANFVANATEFTNYDEATRVLWQKGDVAAAAIDNSVTPALFTIGVAGGTVRGAALVTASAKSAGTGVLIAASRFVADKVLAEDDEIRVRYSLGLNP